MSMSMYAMKYSKERCSSIESACAEFTWDFLADYIPCSLGDYINYHEFIKNIFEREVQIEETQDNFIFLSEFDFVDLKL